MLLVILAGCVVCLVYNSELVLETLQLGFDGFGVLLDFFVVGDGLLDLLLYLLYFIGFWSFLDWWGCSLKGL